MSSLRQKIHEAVLVKDLIAQGFRLKEDEDFAYLYLGDKLIGTYNATKVTVEQLREDAQKEVSNGTTKLVGRECNKC